MHRRIVPCWKKLFSGKDFALESEEAATDFSALSTFSSVFDIAHAYPHTKSHVFPALLRSAIDIFLFGLTASDESDESANDDERGRRKKGHCFATYVRAVLQSIYLLFLLLVLNPN